MADHPSPIELEQWQVDRADAGIGRHVQACAECREYVAGLERIRQGFLAREQPEAFVRRIRQVATERPERPKRFGWMVLAPAAAVALVLLVVLMLPKPGPDDSDQLRFKGMPQLAAVVLRKGKQTRFTDRFEIMAGDRIRVELTLPRRQTVTVGIFEQGKRWLPLAEEMVMEAGVHLLQRTLRVDSRPTNGWIVVGAPDAVKDAVSLQRFESTEGVTSLRLEVGSRP